jgi:hypothetical protein
MGTKNLNRLSLPIIRIDKSLEKYKGKVIFKEKLDEANRVLKIVGVPKSVKKHSGS